MTVKRYQGEYIRLNSIKEANITMLYRKFSQRRKRDEKAGMFKKNPPVKGATDRFTVERSMGFPLNPTGCD